MAVLSGATASGRLLGSGILTTTNSTILYTAKGYTANVVSDSGATSGTSGAGPSTAYIKEIILCNYSASPVTVNIAVDGANLIAGLSINASDTKVLSGLNTMMNAGATIAGGAGTANAVSYIISGVEVQ